MPDNHEDRGVYVADGSIHAADTPGKHHPDLKFALGGLHPWEWAFNAPAFTKYTLNPWLRLLVLPHKQLIMLPLIGKMGASSFSRV